MRKYPRDGGNYLQSDRGRTSGLRRSRGFGLIVRFLGDEFPFWAMDQAVNLSGVTADVRLVPSTESMPQARDIIGFENKCKVQDNERFIVLPVKPWVAANAPSFGFRVNSSGADLCMEPAGTP